MSESRTLVRDPDTLHFPDMTVRVCCMCPRVLGCPRESSRTTLQKLLACVRDCSSVRDSPSRGGSGRLLKIASRPRCRRFPGRNGIAQTQENSRTHGHLQVYPGRVVSIPGVGKSRALGQPAYPGRSAHGNCSPLPDNRIFPGDGVFCSRAVVRSRTLGCLH